MHIRDILIPGGAAKLNEGFRIDLMAIHAAAADAAKHLKQWQVKEDSKKARDP